MEFAFDVVGLLGAPIGHDGPPGTQDFLICFLVMLVSGGLWGSSMRAACELTAVECCPACSRPGVQLCAFVDGRNIRQHDAAMPGDGKAVGSRTRLAKARDVLHSTIAACQSSKLCPSLVSSASFL